MSVRNTNSKVTMLSSEGEIYHTKLHPSREVMNYPLWWQSVMVKNSANEK